MLEIKVWDVSHGSAVWVKFPNGRNMVVDLGADGSGADCFSPLRMMKTVYGVQQLDYAVITHGHADHLDDIFRLHELYYPGVLFTPRHLTDDEIRAGNRDGDMNVVERYLVVRQEYTSPVPFNLDASVTANTGEASFRFFTPSLCSKQNLNNHSLVAVISYQGMKIVIPGDNEAPSWNELMRNLSFNMAVQNTTVLIAPHHGRDAGFCAELLDLMNPRLIVISDGAACDTSVTGRYSEKASGCFVQNGIGKVDTRKCVTTRQDGHVMLRFGLNNNQPTFWVSTSKPVVAPPSLPTLRDALLARTQRW
jgi:beta-lactamase superfamily II metal-dependent hydrolase